MGNQSTTEQTSGQTSDFFTPSTTVTDPVVGNGTTDGPAPPIAFINCGSPTDGHDSNDRVTLSGQSSAFSDPTSTAVKADNPDFAAFGRSHRWHWADFGFSITVPVPGEYDVTLVFCEIYSGAFGVGKRVFDVVVEGSAAQEFKNVDVFKEAGANTVHTIALQNVSADSVINVRLRKGAAENPFISGIVVGAVENPVVPKPRPPIPEPDVTVTKQQYDSCINNIRAFVAEARSSGPENVRVPPVFMFHAPGEKVRGLVFTFHGFAQYHYDHRIIGRYLYDQGYDIVHTMLAGHMYSGKQWPQTLLSEEYGGKSVPQTVFQNPELQRLLAETQTDPTKIPRLITRLQQLNPDFERVMSAQTYMNSIDSDEDPNFQRFFDSNHRDYFHEGAKYLRMCDAHPGPVHVMGLSGGATTALALSGMYPDRISRCIPMAPPLELWEPVPNTQRSLINYIGPLGVAPDFSWDPKKPFPVSAFTALGRFGGSVSSSKVVKDVFKSKQVQMFMVLTEDEDAADIPTNKKFFADCGGLGASHQFFIYPFNYGVPHPLLDPTSPSRSLRNQYYKPFYQMIYTFLTVGHIDTAAMLQTKPVRGLPLPPEAVRGNEPEYRKAAQN